MSVSYGSHNVAGWSGFDGAPQVLTITKPTGLAAGDMMVAFIASQNTSGADTPTGWTNLAGLTVSSQDTLWAWAKVADSSDASATDFDFTWGEGGNGGVGSSAYGILYRMTSTGTFNVAALLTDTGTDNTGTTRVFTGGITQVVANAVLLMATFTTGDQVTHSNYAVATSNPTWTERADSADATGSETSFSSASGPRSAAGATGDFQVDISADVSSASGGVLVCVQETENVTVSPAVITMTASVQAPAVSAGATVSPSVITMTSSVQAPTVSAGTAKWVNADKNSVSVSNVDKT